MLIVSFTSAPVVLIATPTVAPPSNIPGIFIAARPEIIPATPGRSLNIISAPCPLLSPGLSPPPGRLTPSEIVTPVMAKRVTVLVAPPVVRVTRSKKKSPESVTPATVIDALANARK